MVNKSTKPWRFDGPCAFQTDPSWYETYWYEEPAPRRPSPFSRRIATLVYLFRRFSVLLGQFAERSRTGTVWARAIGQKQCQCWHAVVSPQMPANDPVTGRPRIANTGV
jgi:hypothetical protein